METDSYFCENIVGLRSISLTEGRAFLGEHRSIKRTAKQIQDRVGSNCNSK